MLAEHIWVAMSGVVAAIVLAALLMVRLSLKHRRAFRTAAEELGLQWRQKGFLQPGRVKGEVDGVPIAIRTTTQGIGSFERLVTVVEAGIEPQLPIDVRLGRENVLSNLAHGFGVHDLEFGDARFDKLYRVTGSDADAVARLFDEEARLALVVLARDADDLHLDRRKLRWEQAGRVLDPKALERVVKAAVFSVKALQRE
ncbi:MAG: hypothetical protein H6732_13900 [Alphaproteobacteria bacterium]|nr:hypothetical protein [Alphaproteobacteria bacterium]